MLQKSECESSLQAFISYSDVFPFSELATYHHDAPYKSQTCTATYLLSGTVLRRHQYKGVSNGDIDMEEGPSSTQQDEEDDEDGDGDDVSQVQVTIVNEADLEGSSYFEKQLRILTFYHSCEGFLRQSSFNPCVQLVTVTNPRSGFLVCSFDSRSHLGLFYRMLAWFVPQLNTSEARIKMQQSTWLVRLVEWLALTSR